MVVRAHFGELNRRTFLASLAGAGAAAMLGAGGSEAQTAFPALLTRSVPASGERIPAVGMGSWITFNVGDDTALRNDRAQVLQAFFDRGGTLIDSSPMYGSSEAVIGDGLERIGRTNAAFAATKVWTPIAGSGREQMRDSRQLWGRQRFDLMQIHNLLNWEGHLPGLLEDKAAGRIRYVGVTTSHGRRHDDLERVMESRPVDFVQFTYNVVDRAAEARLLPMAAERGIGVLINRPFRGGQLFESIGRGPLPAWADETGCRTWAEFFLKFIVSHPAVTCTIPATSRVDHMHENMGALSGPLPDEAMRTRMVRHVESA